MSVICTLFSHSLLFIHQSLQPFSVGCFLGRRLVLSLLRIRPCWGLLLFSPSGPDISWSSVPKARQYFSWEFNLTIYQSVCKWHSLLMYYSMVLFATVALSHTLFAIHCNPQILFCRRLFFLIPSLCRWTFLHYNGNLSFPIFFLEMVSFIIKTVLNSISQFAWGPFYRGHLQIPPLRGFGYTKMFDFFFKFNLCFDFAGIVISPWV